MRHRINDLTWEQFRDLVPRKTDLAFVPVGTIEAHGIIPLGTDTLIPEKLAAELAPKFGALIAPSIPYGVTNSLLAWPGSTTVSSAAFRSYLFEACAGLVDAGLRRIVILNGHGGHSSEVAEVVGRLWNEKKAFAASAEWWGFIAPFVDQIYGEHTGGHAGIEETAMILAIDPLLVASNRKDKVRRFPRMSGLRTRPFPATVILDKAEKNADGALDLDRDKAIAFLASCVLEMERVLKEVFAGWDEIRAK